MLSEQKRAFVAVLLSGLVLFSWQYFFSPKPVLIDPLKNVVAPNVSLGTDNGSSEAKVATGTTTEEASLGQGVVQSYVFENNNQKLIFDSRFNFLEYKTKNNYAEFKGFFGLNTLLSPIKFNNITFFIDKVEIFQDYFQATDTKNDIVINGKFKDSGALEITLNSKAVPYFFLKSSKESEDKNHQRYFVSLISKTERETVGSELLTEGNLKWFGLDYNYHFFAFNFPKKALGKLSANEVGEVAFYPTTIEKDFSFEIYFTKKNYDLLTSLGNGLELSVDFGFWGIIAVPILRGLQFFYKFIPNYGISIIILTILIRLITFPLQYKSFKSMKKMQLLQPELTKIKEKFKDDPQRLQKETMGLFKNAGANPLGGCLPLLLQMPFFMAFYKVLYAAVELVHAPFYGWINDLSVKDPFFVLPVLMTITMFIQQKMTPAAGVDPNQQKIMLFMPIVFGFIMKDLPAGLVLYIFVSTILGIVQQFFVNKSVTV